MGLHPPSSLKFCGEEIAKEFFFLTPYRTPCPACSTTSLGGTCVGTGGSLRSTPLLNHHPHPGAAAWTATGNASPSIWITTERDLSSCRRFTRRISLEQRNETAPQVSRPPGRPDTSFVTWDLFLLGFVFKSLFLLPLMILPAVVGEGKAIRGGTAQPQTAPQHPGPAARSVHTLMAFWEEAGYVPFPRPQR